MGVTLEDLGLSQEELQDRVIESLCDKLLKDSWFDEEEGATSRPSSFREKLDKEIQRRIDEGVSRVADRGFDAQNAIESLCIQKTNQWGEKTGQPMTFVEYLVHRAEAWMEEPVDYNGKAKISGDYRWKQSSTRMAYAVDKYISHHIETAMKQVIQDGNKILVGGLQATIKAKLAEIAEALNVTVKVG